MNIASARKLYKECKLSVRKILKTSPNLEARKLYEITSTKHVNSVSIINQIVSTEPEKYKVRKNCYKIFNKNNHEKRWDGFMPLKKQSNIIQSITIHSSSKEISRWRRLVKSFPINLHNFCRKYLVSSLANRTNLKRWKISENSNCELCNCPKTQLHIFNHCKLAFDWCEWRHNSVVLTICNHLKTKVANDLLQVYVDIDGYVNPATLFKKRDQAIITNMDDNLRHRARPDIVLKNNNQITAIELTCPYETNREKSRKFKKRWYKNLKNELITSTSIFKLILLEIISLGFTINYVKRLINFMLKLNLGYERIIYKCQEVAIRTSFFIYCRRGYCRQWLNSELLSYT